MAAPPRNLAEIYEAVCAENGVKINPDVLGVLRETNETRLTFGQRLTDDDVLVVSECLRRSPSVTGLDLKFSSVTDEGVKHIAHLLQQENSCLRSLDLTFNDILSEGAEILSTSLKCNHSLLSLRLSGNKVGNRGAMHVATMLQDTQSVIAVAIAVKNNNTLHHVDLSRPLLFSLQEEWAEHCSLMLAVNNSLLELHLGKMMMTDTGMERLTEGLRLNHSLRYLDLHCNRVTRDGARRLAEVLKQNPTLEVIDLSSNRNEDEGAAYLSDALMRPGCGLRELSVNNNNIRTDGLLALTHAMKANATLTHIYIWGNHLEEEPVCKAFRELISSGRLLPQQTDVSVCEVDCRVFLAKAFNNLRRRYDEETLWEPAAPPTDGDASGLTVHQRNRNKRWK
ncbi:leucine-rich repeat-containing protein 34 [Solea solea]|uniref:leucine-rich repeat-containing protein 34 n=1 Tax=Solea solea TaxID=90069 RepID=UPI00272C0D85|nr:leucine-rich repeat-containing protein 34 [Solea solea]